MDTTNEIGTRVIPIRTTKMTYIMFPGPPGLAVSTLCDIQNLYRNGTIPLLVESPEQIERDGWYCFALTEGNDLIDCTPQDSEEHD
jgi:hypothetical protein